MVSVVKADGAKLVESEYFAAELCQRAHRQHQKKSAVCECMARRPQSGVAYLAKTDKRLMSVNSHAANIPDAASRPALNPSS